MQAGGSIKLEFAYGIAEATYRIVLRALPLYLLHGWRLPLFYWPSIAESVVFQESKSSPVDLTEYPLQAGSDITPTSLKFENSVPSAVPKELVSVRKLGRSKASVCRLLG